MSKLADIEKVIVGLFPKGVLKDTTWEYGFKFDYEKEIKTIAYATNLSPLTINKAVEVGADLLITHHDSWPFMNKQREHCHKLLRDNTLNHVFVHTPLDAAEFGTGYSLANSIGMENLKPAVPYHGHLVGVVGQAKPQGFNSFVSNCEKVLSEKVRAFKNNSSPVSKVLIVTGGGNETSSLDVAIQEKCDTYITGEYSMYLQHYAEFHKINLVIGSHTKTEIIGVRNFVKKIIASLGKSIKVIEIDEPSY